MTPVWAGGASPELNRAIGEFVADRVWRDGRRFGEHTSMGVEQGGRIVAGVIFHNYDPWAGVIEISGASDTPRWLTRPVLYAMYAYPFDQLGCQMVVQRNSEHNARLNSILRRYGFDEYRIRRGRGRNEDELVFTLTDNQWRSNGFHKEHGNEQTESA